MKLFQTFATMYTSAEGSVCVISYNDPVFYIDHVTLLFKVSLSCLYSRMLMSLLALWSIVAWSSWIHTTLQMAIAMFMIPVRYIDTTSHILPDHYFLFFL